MTGRVLAAAAFALVAYAGEAVDFSGRWTLVRGQSEVGVAPKPAETLEVDQDAAAIRCKEGALTWAGKFDGGSTRTRSVGGSANTRIKWEGSALLVNTILSGENGDYTRTDRWKLSHDGATLTVHREIVRRSGTVEATLVYERPERVASVRAAQAMDGPKRYVVPAGTRIPLTALNSISTKHSSEGDRIYLTTAFPVVIDGRVVIPPGSYVSGTVTLSKRPGRVAGRGELYLRFDSLTLPNGTTRDFRARIGGLDSDAKGRLDRDEGRIEGEGGRGADARKVGETTAAGASVGTLGGGVAGHPGMGAGVGAAAGAAVGLASVLLTRGPDVELPKGSTIEMNIDRPLEFTEAELATAPRR